VSAFLLHIAVYVDILLACKIPLYDSFFYSTIKGVFFLLSVFTGSVQSACRRRGFFSQLVKVSKKSGSQDFLKKPAII
ncbi:MAG: hypothetical protein SPF03_11250, partial [Faecalimonas umbilicata]|uniref:hypothetical protein n=1 Tax=Faecalimonas umbilicata TaxID=1912855 RepID=UPI002A82A480